ncbi:hypothetical protein Tsubulata_010148 [Turnera subulata]|uniref:Fungal lipase-like domain-containing protein n=1 Tax=Turnera subulata TaxID=218843 RepID=A0A9Q0G7J3_9ROSI|nr:hypothetical protein Tsubulata_010148 [Turnera subulata]
MQVSKLVKSLRISTIILGISNLAVGIAGGFLVLVVFQDCDGKSLTTPVVGVSLAAALKILAMVRTGMAQRATATTILDSPADNVNRLKRRISYKRWLWWSRFTLIITLLQTVCAFYLLFIVVQHVSDDGTSYECSEGMASNNNQGKLKLLVSYVVMVFLVPLIHCAVGSDVLSWRSFYTTQDDVWRAHYQEVFDHGIREALCCLGRVKYLSVSKEDEVFSVAKLLGDLVTYRASGTGHMELLAGLALLHRQSESPEIHDGQPDAPEDQISEALNFHEFAEAAYTGPLLDFGRHTVFFSCAWLHRQGILTPWTRNRRPILIGDNWWRGHAAAYLNYVKLPAEALRRGRVCQEKCEAAYFIVVLHRLRTVVIAVRGTETPEDLITDGLGRESPLSMEDLDGLIKHVLLSLSLSLSLSLTKHDGEDRGSSSPIHPDVKRRVESSFPHYGHSGIIEAARDLYMQIEGNPCCNDAGSESGGFLTSLLGAGCECDGYSVRIVGHSLGGAIAAMIGLRLYRQFPNLHVYAYGPLPCLDLVTAEACSDFVTSIVHDNEFSARLSVGSVLRLRAAAIMALSEDSKTDTALVLRLARRFLYVSKYQRGTLVEYPTNVNSATTTVQEQNQDMYKGNHKMDQINPLSDESKTMLAGNFEDKTFENPFYNSAAAASNSSDIENPFCNSAVAPNSSDTENPFYDSAASPSSSNRHEPFYTSTAVLNTSDVENPLCSSGEAITPLDDPVSEFLETVPKSGSGLAGENVEMFLPGLVIHVVPEQRDTSLSMWKSWRFQASGESYRAYLANREMFKDIVVSPNMFLDHLPWRCHNALQKVLEVGNTKGLLDVAQTV